MNALDKLLIKVRACTLCAEHLSHALRPVVRISATARVLIVVNR
jgi:uracil-DNA glycosylase